MNAVAPRRKKTTSKYLSPDGDQTTTSRSDSKDHLLLTLESLLLTLRAKRISMGTLHAVLHLYLNQSSQLSLTILANNVGITSAAITSTADSLERLGFAKREINPDDRRLIFISLTPRGKVFAEWLSTNLREGI